jgi:Autotransporter beta-domain
MKRMILFGTLLSGFSLNVIAQSSDIQKPITITPTLAVQNVGWLENGTLGSASLKIQTQISKKINFSAEGGAFKSLGETNPSFSGTNAVPSFSCIAVGGFDNKTSSPTSISGNFNGTLGTPKTYMQGGFVNIDAGIPIKLGDSSKFAIEPFVGVEGKMWSRSAEFGTEGNTTVFEEKYKMLSPSLGAKLNYTSKSKVKVSLRISTSYPLISKMKTDEKNLTLPNTEIDLTKMLSHSIELGARIKKVTIKLRYERINFGTADTVRGYAMPSSSANVSGVSVGYDF